MRSTRISRNAPSLDTCQPSDSGYKRRCQPRNLQICREGLGCAEPPSRRVLGQSSTQRNESVSGTPLQCMVSDLKWSDWHEAAITSEANETACDHLLKHYRQGRQQEDLCFGLWTPSNGAERETAIVRDILLPRNGERHLHGNVSFEPNYLSRATRAAIRSGQGLVFMHSHPSSGWQDMSVPDIRAERDRISDTARATGKPLVGMTVGIDGHWSARVWRERARGKTKVISKKVRVLERSRLVIWERPKSKGPCRQKQRRTIDTWGEEKQRR